MSESHEQQALFDYCHGLGGNVDNRLRMLHVIANGAWRGVGQMEAGMKESAGIPDVFLPVPTAIFNGLYIELKVPGGKVSSKQREWIKALRRQGYAAEVCVGAEKAIEMIHQYLSGELPPF